MSMNETPSGERIHIGFFGRRNAGKSSLVNAITNQELSVVSDTLGTTTDAVTKAMELLPLGPVVIMDTPGFDDEGELGMLRVKKTKQVLAKADIAVLVADVTKGLGACESELISIFKEQNTPYLIAWNKSDICADERVSLKESDNEIYVSALTKQNIEELKEKIGRFAGVAQAGNPLVSDLVKPMDTVVLVIPIDEAAPKGRLILPQQQVIRELLEAGAVSICVKETELAALLEKMAPKKPDLVITDSQAFKQVAEEVPQDVMLTSFSILMARHKGFLQVAVDGCHAIDSLKAGDHVLIAEGCTHHRQCNDIGSVKIPRWLKAHVGQELVIETCSGRDFPEDLSSYALVIHCGGCMLNEKEVRYRMKCAKAQGVPFTNYGIAIAHMNGILERSIRAIPMTSQAMNLIDTLYETHDLSDEQFKTLLSELTEEEEEYLYAKARETAQKIYGKDIFLRGLIEFTNICKNNCYYCGIRSGNANANRYRLTPEQILECSDKGYELGFRTIVLQGGEDPYFTDEKICDIVGTIKQRHPDVAVTLSIGEKERESYEAYFAAGADRYLLRHETANEAHYGMLHPTELSAEHRKNCLFALKEIGYQVGCGIMVGSPYQTKEHIIEDLRFMQKLNPHMIGIGPFIPHKDTPFANEAPGLLKDTLHLLAILRLMFPRVLLPATTALGTIHPLGREMGVKAGANVIMPNLSPGEVRKDYMLYDGKICTGEEAAECRSCIEKRMANIGYHVVVDRGDYKEE